MSGVQLPDPDQPQIYEVKLRGHLDEDWSNWFGDRSGGVTVTPQDDGTTLLTCQVIDQAALHGLLRQIRDLSLPLISVNRMEA